MVHSALIILHAGFATTAFVLGVTVMAAIPTSIRSGRFIAYCVCAVLAVATLITVVFVDLGTLPPVKRIAFSALGALGIYMLFRTGQASRVLAAASGSWRTKFIGHIGFVLISLFDGFCIVTAIDLRLPPIVIAVVAVAGVVAGIVAIRLLGRREVRHEALSATI